jgi:hypothetical protein
VHVLHRARCWRDLPPPGGVDAIFDDEFGRPRQFQIIPGEGKLQSLGEIALAAIFAKAADLDRGFAIADRACLDFEISLLRAATCWNSYAEARIRRLGGKQLGERDGLGGRTLPGRQQSESNHEQRTFGKAKRVHRFLSLGRHYEDPRIQHLILEGGRATQTLSK